jgi:osmotically-inducible protein OsmY
MQTTRCRVIAAAVAAALSGAAGASEAGGGDHPEYRVAQLDATEFVTARAIPERARAAQYLEDGMITARVKAALLKDPVMSGLRVGVETHQGTVVLSGFVDNEGQARRAAGIAASVQGVVNVKNALAAGS